VDVIETGKKFIVGVTRKRKVTVDVVDKGMTISESVNKGEIQDEIGVVIYVLDTLKLTGKR
jgi:hypothetical protein